MCVSVCVSAHDFRCINNYYLCITLLLYLPFLLIQFSSFSSILLSPATLNLVTLLQPYNVRPRFKCLSIY